ncbi:hypothetical protein [Bradyrhizobium frederickii]|uniref:hypothetical protein n=1 Tax=Bradyrhizobium frederickii TaxID=2560054 RepID=UPI00142FDA2C|nr:hypothetical protein [Bradyrhizobium frederickii]
MKMDRGIVPPELSEPPPDARGWIAWQPSTGKAWRKIDGKWLPIAEANAIVETRKS